MTSKTTGDIHLISLATEVAEQLGAMDKGCEAKRVLSAIAQIYYDILEFALDPARFVVRDTNAQTLAHWLLSAEATVLTVVAAQHRVHLRRSADPFRVVVEGVEAREVVLATST